MFSTTTREVASHPSLVVLLTYVDMKKTFAGVTLAFQYTHTHRLEGMGWSPAIQIEL